MQRGFRKGKGERYEKEGGKKEGLRSMRKTQD
jgi:hypothetical protein